MCISCGNLLMQREFLYRWNRMGDSHWRIISWNQLTYFTANLSYKFAKCIKIRNLFDSFACILFLPTLSVCGTLNRILGSGLRISRSGTTSQTSVDRGSRSGKHMWTQGNLSLRLIYQTFVMFSWQRITMLECERYRKQKW